MSLPSFSLEGKVAIITGVGLGLGRDVALTFAHAGADVAICDLIVDDGNLASVADEIKKLVRRSLAVQTDVSSKTDFPVPDFKGFIIVFKY